MGAFQLTHSLCPEQWLLQRNQNIKTGSRIFVALHKNTNKKTAFSCYATRQRNMVQVYAPIKEYDTCIVLRDQHGACYKYDVRKINGVVIDKPEQINVRFKFDESSSDKFLCLDMLRLADIEHILTYGSFDTVSQMALKQLLLAAKAAAHREFKGNELALDFMQGVYAGIKDKTVEALASATIVESILNDYRCAINGKEFNEGVMRYQDVQELLSRLVRLRCCKAEQAELIDRITTWAEQENFSGIHRINVTATGQLWVQYVENDKEYRAIFSTNQHGKSKLGKAKIVGFDQTCFSYSIDI